VKRSQIFVRDGYRCVYCGGCFEPALLSIDHVQPKVRGGDGPDSNVVTACTACHTAWRAWPLPRYLAAYPDARRNFIPWCGM